MKPLHYLLPGLAALSILVSSCQMRTGSSAQTSGQDTLSTFRHAEADSVRQAFLFAWNNYVQFAWGHDALMPLTHQPHDWYGAGHSLEMTPLDGYDSMVLLGLKQQADSAKTLILDSLNLNQDISVSNFETTIRLLGGLLSAYELDGDSRFLSKAQDLANRLKKAFNSPTGMPYRFVNLKTGKTSGAQSNPAEIGTMILEYGTLSRLTGDSSYYALAKRAMVYLYDRRNAKTGLVGSWIDVNTGRWIDAESSISGGTDSYYEYLLKGWKLFGDPDLKRMWDSSLMAINTHLADSSHNGFWYGHANMDTGRINQTQYGALDAFFAACLVLTGDTAHARKLQASNFKMWTLAGLEPEVLDYSTMKILNPYYDLRPENLESCYYLYRTTHDPQYLYMGRDMFQSIVKNCRCAYGFAAIKDVRNMTPDNSMESYFFAETLKYAYLIFAPDSTLDFNRIVFNTEAHPLKRS